MEMKRLRTCMGIARSLLFLFMLLGSFNARALSFQEGAWDVSFNESSHLLTITCDGRKVVNGGYARASFDRGAAPESQLNTQTASFKGHTTETVSTCFGLGQQHSFTFEQNGVTIIQRIAFYETLPYFVVQLSLTQGNGPLRSNYLVPLCSETSTEILPAGTRNRMLWVPFDNDGWVRYQAYRLSRSMDSFSATALYDAGSRYGVVTGAVDHDIWKNAIHIEASNQNRVDNLALISGFVNSTSRDSIAHGKMVGDTVTSARFIVGTFADWRAGMETFAAACQTVKAGRQWADGVPYYWNSWGVMQEKVNYQGVMDVMHYIHDNLMPKGFHDKDGKVLISLDSYWGNLNDTQMKQFVDSCKKLNMIPGVYMCPFADWAGWDRPIEGTSKYTWGDIWLMRDGRRAINNGSICIDPTHPGTKISNKMQIDRMKRFGIKYIKMDFMSHGAIEADSWYNKNVHTGIQAYNEGMDFIRKQCGDDIYINLSISPIFPYQYAEGRRTCCDAYSSLGNTEYVMNSSSFGWWLDGLYFANDPDNLVLKSKYDGATETKGENRARITSGAVTGMFSASDNFSDAVEYGYPAQSRERGLELFTNEDVNAISRTCKAFRPVEGDKAKADGAENLMTYDNEKYVYLAVINYYTIITHVADRITFERLGIDGNDVAEVKELWTQTAVDFNATGFDYDCPMKDARIYRIQRKAASNGISQLTEPSRNDGPITRKYFENGTLVIEKNGKQYNGMGLGIKE